MKAAPRMPLFRVAKLLTVKPLRITSWPSPLDELMMTLATVSMAVLPFRESALVPRIERVAVSAICSGARTWSPAAPVRVTSPARETPAVLLS